MLSYTYLSPGKFGLIQKPKPVLRHDRDAIVRVTLSSICTSDLHIKHGTVPRAIPGVTVGHEMVGIVESVGAEVSTVKPGDRVSVNVETFCGTCFFCQHGYVNNCTDPNGGWALGCRIDGGQAEYVRVPYADQGLTIIPDTVTDRQALFVGDLLATGFWATRISEIGPEDTVLLLGAGPTGICTLLCALLKEPRKIIVCEPDPMRRAFVQTLIRIRNPDIFCQHGYVNNCTDPNGGWALGCRIDGGQAEYVRVPYADQGLTIIPDTVTDRQALFVGDLLATGFWATRISEIGPEDTVLLLGAGPTGICTLLCALLKEPRKIIVCEPDPMRRAFVQTQYPQVLTTTPEEVVSVVRKEGAHGGADVVLEIAGSSDSFQLAWQCARPNAIVTIVAMYDRPQILPLPEMYGKNLTFKTGGVDGCHCKEVLSLIQTGQLDTTPLITHTFPLTEIEAAYDLFEYRRDGVIKVAIQGT